MRPPDQTRDDALARLFEQMRAESLARVLPPGAAVARVAAWRRRRRRRRALAVVAATVGMVLAGGLGAGVTELVLSQRAQRVTAAADASGSAGAPVGAAPAPASSAPAAPGGTAFGASGLPASPSPTYQATRCHTDELSARLAQPADTPPAGVRYADLGLTNTAGHPCRMYGYPGMQLLDATGAGLPTTVVRDRSVSPTLFTLQPGETGWARLSWAVLPEPGETAPCTPGARALWITPPDEFTQLTLTLSLDVCHHGEIITGPTHP